MHTRYSTILVSPSSTILRNSPLEPLWVNSLRRNSVGPSMLSAKHKAFGKDSSTASAAAANRPLTDVSCTIPTLCSTVAGNRASSLVIFFITTGSRGILLDVENAMKTSPDEFGPNHPFSQRPQTPACPAYPVA